MAVPYIDNAKWNFRVGEEKFCRYENWNKSRLVHDFWVDEHVLKSLKKTTFDRNTHINDLLTDSRMICAQPFVHIDLHVKSCFLLFSIIQTILADDAQSTNQNSTKLGYRWSVSISIKRSFVLAFQNLWNHSKIMYQSWFIPIFVPAKFFLSYPKISFCVVVLGGPPSMTKF